MELTQKRRMILNELNSFSVPVTAMQLHRSSSAKINLATVYRALQYLSENRCIETFTLDCRKEGVVKYFYSRKNPHEHFFHCEKCHSFIPFRSCSVEKDAREFEKENGCSIYTHVLYFTGTCSQCRN